MTFHAGRRFNAALANVGSLAPGLFLCALIACLSLALQQFEEQLLGYSYVGSLIIAIVIGMAVRTVWRPSQRWDVGIAFSAKQILEVAVMLLGASISFAAIAESGPLLLSTVIFAVIVSLGGSYALSRSLGLARRDARNKDGTRGP